MADEVCRVGENIAAGGMIPVIVTVNDVADGNVEASVEFLLQPLRHPGTDGVGQNDAFGRDQKHGPVIVHCCSPGIAVDVADAEDRYVIGIRAPQLGHLCGALRHSHECRSPACQHLVQSSAIHHLENDNPSDRQTAWMVLRPRANTEYASGVSGALFQTHPATFFVMQ